MGKKLLLLFLISVGISTIIYSVNNWHYINHTLAIMVIIAVGIILFIVCLRILLSCRKKGVAAQCPKCKKLWARVYDGSAVIEEKPDYKTVYLTDKHYDKEGQKIGTTERSEQRHVIDIYTRHSYHCKFCGHKWTGISYCSAEG